MSLPGSSKKKKEGSEKKNDTHNTATISSPTAVTSTNNFQPAPPTTPPTERLPPPASPKAEHEDFNGDDRPAGSNSPTSVVNPPKQLITIYSYDATEENEISFAEGETLYLVEKDDSGWWRGRNTKGDEGLFPSNFVEVVGEEGNSGSIEINKDFRALYDYEAEDETELTIKEGENFKSCFRN